MENKDKYFMREAIKEAKLAYYKNEVPVGCVIVLNDEIIAKAHNLKEINKTVTAHAEILAINTASKKLDNWRLSDCVMYVTLEPCSMCASAIVASRIKRVVIGALDNKEGAVISSKHIFENNHNHRLLLSSKVYEKECEALIIDFLSKKR